jgi:hypothetical protein
MRALTLIFLCSLLAAHGLSAQATTHEGKLLERLEAQYKSSINPENAPVFDPASKKFEDGAKLGLQKEARLKTAYDGDKSFDQMIKKETRSFLGIKNPWFGKKIFVTQDAFLKKPYALNKNQSPFATKDATVKEFQDANKAMDSRSDPMPRPQVVPQGTAQGSIDAREGTEVKKMTIEQVRELLNKN